MPPTVILIDHPYCCNLMSPQKKRLPSEQYVAIISDLNTVIGVSHNPGATVCDHCGSQSGPVPGLDGVQAVRFSPTEVSACRIRISHRLFILTVL